MPNNEVEIVVTSKNRTRTGFEQARAEAQRFAGDLDRLADDAGVSGERAGDQFSGRFAGELDELRGPSRAAGGAAGDAFADGFTRDATGRLRDSRGRFVREASEIGEAISDTISESTDRSTRRRRGFFSSIGSSIGNMISSGFSGMGELVAKNLGHMATSVVGGFSSILAAGVVLIPMLSTIAGLIMAVGGAAIAGLAGIPVLLMGLAGPIAAVMLGLDGLKRAASVLEGPINRLRTAVSDTFEKTMKPVLASLKPVFPVLQAGLVGVAKSVSGFAKGLAQVVTSKAGLQAIRDALAGVQTFLNTLLPGAKRLFQAFLDIAGTKSLYETLGETFRTVADRFGRFLEQIRESGKLEQALVSIKELMFPIMNLFTQLGNAALDFFNGAAPGLEAFIGSIANLVGRIDWVTLGNAFSRVFERLGEWINNIPQETIDWFVQAFDNLADTIIGMIDSGALDALVIAFGGLVIVFQKVVEAITWLWNRFKEFRSFIDGIPAWWNGVWGSVKLFFSGHWNAIVNTVSNAASSIKNWIVGGVSGAYQAVVGWLGKAVEWVRGLPGKITGALGNLGGLLWNHGASLMNGLLNGIRSAATSIWNFVSGIAGKIAALKGPLPYDKIVLTPNGEALMSGLYEGLATGFQPVETLVSSMADRLAGIMPNQFTTTVTGAGSGGVSGPGGTTAGGAPRAVVEIRSGGSRLDDFLVELLRRSIRAQGGDVQVVLGS